MSNSLFRPGPIPLAVLDSAGNKQKTLFLPACGAGMRLIEWEKDAEVRKIPGVGERERVLGYLPILTLKWAAYDDRPGRLSIGVEDGQRPSVEQLLQLLSMPSGSLKVGLGQGGAGFVVGAIKLAGAKVVGGRGFAGDLQLVMRGRDYRSEMTLGAF